jgi:tetratricopeptide (TPR) repeat protein
MLPARIFRLLKFFGVRGDRKLAFSYLMDVCKGDNLFSPVAACTICGYHCYIEFLAGFGKPDVKLVESILKDYHKRYPDSGFFLIFDATLEQIKGNPSTAIDLYQRSSEKFQDWKEWQNTCDWLIVWCHAIQSNWQEALKYTKILMDNCSWSKCTFTYQYAAILKMVADEEMDLEKKIALRKDVDYYLKLAPTLKRSFAGKTMFIEKFVTKRCQIYWTEKEKVAKNEKNSIFSITTMSENNNQLVMNESDDLIEHNDIFVLPILELFLFWNIFSTTRNENAKLLTDSFITRINHKLKIFDWSRDEHQEKHLFLLLMKGICLKSVGQSEEAIECLTVVLSNENLLNLYSHLAPLASLELGMLFKEKRDYSRAEKYLNQSMDNYSHYLNETLVHIRAHSALTSIKEDLKSRSSSISKTIPYGCSDVVLTKIPSSDSLAFEDAVETLGG